MPKVSVIIPTYNRKDLVVCAIRSVLAQTYGDYELLVVDDGSSDGTSDVLMGFDDSRLRVIRQQNSGRSAARNRGVSCSSGEYVAFLDDDDEYLPHKLEHQSEFLNTHSKVGLVAGGHYYIDEQGHRIQMAEPWRGQQGLSLDIWLQGCPFLLQSVLLRRDWWEKVGGLDPSLPQAHDHDFFLRLSAQGCPMEWIHEPVFCYRIHGHNVSRHAFTQTECRIKMLEKFFSSDQAPVSMVKAQAGWYSYHWLLGAVHAFAVGQVDEAHESLRQGIRSDPAALDDPNVLIGHIINFAHSPMQEKNPRDFVNFIFEHLDPQFSVLKRHRRHTLACLEMHRFFDAHRRADARTVLASVLPGVLLDPKWLRNRGVWSILGEAVLGGRIMDRFRKVYRRL